MTDSDSDTVAKDPSNSKWNEKNNKEYIDLATYFQTAHLQALSLHPL